MNKKPQISYLAQLGILLGLFGLCAIVGSFLMGIFWMIFSGKGILTLEKEILNPAYTNLLRNLQLMASVIMFIVPSFIYARIINKQPFQQLGFNSLITGKQFFIVVCIAVAGISLSGALGSLNEMIPVSAKWKETFKKMEDAYNNQVMAMAKMNSMAEYLYVLLVIAIAPAILEEMFFRGALQRLFTNWFKNHWAAIMVTAILFSAIHFSFFGFLPRMVLGVILGLIFYYSRNIWLSIIVHLINNGIAVTALYAMQKRGGNAEEVLKENLPVWYGLIAVVIIILLLKAFYEESIKAGALTLTDGSATQQDNDNPFNT